ncbi:MAG: hypothetical protein NZ777_16510 [Pseudomonadales bacterium]|nr:hypothetical protein [Pseudomonadales bacterium]
MSRPLNPSDESLHQGVNYFEAHLDRNGSHYGLSPFGDVAHIAP